jgi:hypothetical protein
MKPAIGNLMIYEYSKRCFLWTILLPHKIEVTSKKPFKRQQTARNDAVRTAKRLNLKLVETI